VAASEPLPHYTRIANPFLKAQADKEPVMTVNIYAGNLPFSLSDSDIRDLFLPFGEVAQVRVVKDRYSGKSKGFAFVEMTDPAAGKEAIERLNGKEILGRPLKVSVARPRGGFEEKNSHRDRQER
jgi:RNA recognition motif-containing protein